MSTLPGVPPLETADRARPFSLSRPFWGVWESTAGIVTATLLILLLITWLRSGSFPLFAFEGNLALLLSYLVVWVPLTAACAVATYGRGTQSARRDLGFSISLTDVLFGLSIGLLVRGLVSLLEIAVYGRIASGALVLGDVVYNGWWIFGVLVAPILIAPFVEELFFRGLVLRSVLEFFARREASGAVARRLAPTIAIIVSAVLFALLHLTEASTASEALVLGLSTLILGIGTGILAAVTGRVGGAMVAHAMFNATIIVAAFTS